MSSFCFASASIFMALLVAFLGLVLAFSLDDDDDDANRQMTVPVKG
jgi:hypothetical protein